MTVTVQIITATTALVAVIFGPVISLLIARRQIRASVISTNRQAWINSLREAIASFLAKEAIARNLNRLSHADSSSLGRIEEITRLKWHISLLINPQEEDHSRLDSLLDKLTNTINNNNPDSQDVDANIDDLRQEVIKLSQTIFKREWKRVKRGN